MIQKILSIYLLVSYGSLITDSSLIGNSNDVLMTSKNSLTSDIESNQRKELLDNVQIVRQWNANMKLNSLYHENELKNLKDDIKFKIKTYIMSPSKKNNAESLRAVIKSFKDILVKRKSAWLSDRVFKDLSKWPKMIAMISIQVNLSELRSF
jgi:uncharacterized protein YbgA (DUF1722 family)